MNNLQDGKLDLKDLKYYNPKNGELERFILKKGDVLFNRTNSFDLVGKVSIFNVDGEYSFASYLIRLKADDTKLDSRFLNFYLNTPIGLAKIRKYRTPGVSQSNINAQNLKHIQIPLPGRKTQKDLMDKIESIEIGERQSTLKISCSASLQKSLINQVF
jgi:type I restriction enzyme S subunit